MKILALEKENKIVGQKQTPSLLRSEAERVWELYQSGIIREIYFTQEGHQAVIILECANQIQAKNVLESLPLLQAGMIDFEILPLDPYTGFGRLFT